MPIDYGAYRQTNSNLVPRRKQFATEQYIRAAQERQGWWEQAYTQDAATQELAANMPVLGKDRALANQYVQDVNNKIAGRTAEGNLEDHVYDTVRDAQQFKSTANVFMGAYKQRADAEDNIRKNAATMQWNEKDIQEYMNANDNRYEGAQVGPDGRLQASYGVMNAVAKPAVTKIAQEILEGMKADVSRVESFDGNELVYYTKANRREVVTDKRVLAALASGMKGRPEITNWQDYQAQVRTINNPWDMRNMTPEQKAALQPELDKGRPLSSIQYEYESAKSFEDMFKQAGAFGVNKFAYQHNENFLGNATPWRSIYGDNKDEDFGVPAWSIGNNMNVTDFDPNRSILSNKEALNKGVETQKALVTRLKEGPSPDGDAIRIAENKLLALQRSQARIQNIEDNVARDQLNKMAPGKGAELLSLIRNLETTKDKDVQESLVRQINKLAPNLNTSVDEGTGLTASSPYTSTIEPKGGWSSPKGNKQTINESLALHGAPETANRIIKRLNMEVENQTKDLKPGSTGSRDIELAGSTMKTVTDLYKNLIGGKPDQWNYVDPANGETSKPGKDETLENVSHVSYQADGRRYLRTTWSKGTGKNKETVYRLVPLDDSNNNLGRIMDAKLQKMMQYAPKDGPLAGDVEKIRDLILGRDNEVIAQRLAPFESDFVVDPVTGQKRDDMKIERYLRDVGDGTKEESFRLVGRNGTPLTTQYGNFLPNQKGDVNAANLNKIIMETLYPSKTK